MIRVAAFTVLLAFAADPALAANFGLLPEHRAELATPPRLSTRAYLLMEPATGEVLATHNEREPLAPASLTKLMTAYVVFDALQRQLTELDRRVVISERAWRTGGSRTFLELGNSVSVDELLRGLLIQSGNDAAVALAEHLGGTIEGFAEIMNQTAARLGMSDSRFVNPHGLPATGHYSSARDLGLLAQSLVRDFPQYYQLFGEPVHTHNGITQYSRNHLMRRDDSVDGLKTGYTRDAGYCVVNSARRGSLRLISVVLGSHTPAQRFADSEALLEYGFSQVRLETLVSADEVLARVRVWGADADWLPLALGQDLRLLVPAGHERSVEVDVVAPEFELSGEIHPGDLIGKAHVAVDGHTLLVAPLQAQASLREAGFFARAGDAARRLLRDWGWLSDIAYAGSSRPQ